MCGGVASVCKSKGSLHKYLIATGYRLPKYKKVIGCSFTDITVFCWVFFFFAYRAQQLPEYLSMSYSIHSTAHVCLQGICKSIIPGTDFSLLFFLSVLRLVGQQIQLTMWTCGAAANKRRLFLQIELHASIFQAAVVVFAACILIGVCKYAHSHTHTHRQTGFYGPAPKMRFHW